MSARRVTASERIRAEIDALFTDHDRELGEVLEEVAQLSVRLVMQAALEAEVTEFLGRDRYGRGERARAGHRNGYQDITVKCEHITDCAASNAIRVANVNER